MVSIRDVARYANVSTATVSRALRGLSSVTAETRARVESAAAELGYVLPFNASSLASGLTNSVGVVAPFTSRWFFGTVITGIERVLRDEGLDLVLYGIGDAESRTRLFEQMSMRRRVDAMIVLCLPLTKRELAAVRSLGVPVVFVGTRVAGFSSVRIEDFTASAHAVDYLIRLGHERIGLICDDDPAPFGFTTPRQRKQGYLSALHAAGITPLPQWQAVGGFTVAGGEAAMNTLLDGDSPPTAVFALSDEMAYGALRTLRRRRRTVPEDVSLVGFDNHELAAALDLTTVAQPVVEQGSEAVRVLLDELRGRSTTPRDVVVPTELVVRASSGSPVGMPN
ncbi:LacI family DNA-binding transcriptional regulator [Kutzneria buriramensis]|uniref:DNA-binding LacI/PurR family transcriptional regulator n=1 Tax=Kutzneria buriramensis TaxID=1045776 RepID=A0A3E0GUY6_9PSEU|nr:LacI family DNA-binding transcriptional regulator [Kutzneria buriramensis]REH28568.1 DNA-binding LacI/PurR family transcriptional regulator [Kutzneria buriramensis]